MKRVKITETHGWTAKTLRKQERKVKDPALRARVMAVRLVMGLSWKRGRRHAQSSSSIGLYLRRYL